MSGYDLIIIGGGPAGYVGAAEAGRLGLRTCLIERDKVGGVCLNRGCIPTKTMLTSAALLAHFRRAEEFGIDMQGELRPNLKAIIARKDKVVSILVKGVLGLLKKNKVELVRGRGRIVDRGVVEVEGEKPARLEAKNIIIATGSRPANLPGLAIDGKRIISSDELFTMQELPESILIVGAGVIGCEWGFLLKFLGVEVTIVELMPRALPGEDEAVSAVLQREMRKQGIKLLLEDSVVSVQDFAGGATAVLKSGKTLAAEKVLLSIGRQFNTEDLDLPPTGVQLSPRGNIEVDKQLKTRVPGIYAAGDVIGGPLLAHVACAEALTAVANIAGRPAEMDYRVIPAAVFTEPEIGSVGLREHEAQAQGIPYKTAVCEMRMLGRAHAMGEISGLAKLIARADTGLLLGVHIIGPRASDLVAEAGLALKLGATAKDLADTIHAHPTMAEALYEAARELA